MDNETKNLESMKLKPVGANKYGVGPEGEGSPISTNDDYDPHIHRQVENPTTNIETLIHLLKGCLGTGILAMPEAFKNAGLINGFISTILIGALCTYCLHVLVQVQYVLCKRLRVPILTYPESMRIALESGPQCLRIFAPSSPIIVDVFLVLYQFGICCVYVLFVAVNIKDLIDESTGKNFPLLAVMAALLIPFILINCIRNLKLLAPFSTAANVITFVSFGAVCYFVFRGLEDISDRPYVGTLYKYPLFFGTTLFALEAVGVVIALENNMKTPKGFGGYCGVLNVGMIVVVFFYVGMGFFGYWRYGEKAEASITLNFPKGDWVSKSVKILYSLAIFISYGLQGFVPVDILWRTYITKLWLKEGDKLLLWEYVLRIATVFLSFFLAAVIPMLGLVISLFGAFCLSALGIAFPALMEICVRWPKNFGPGNLILVKDILLIIFGIIGLLAGSYSCISEMVVKMGEVKNSTSIANVTTT